jgi:hypothetical protein
MLARYCFIIITFAIVVSFNGCIPENTAPSTIPSPEITRDTRVQLVSHRLELSKGIAPPAVTGVVKSNAEIPLLVAIRVNFYDAKNNFIKAITESELRLPPRKEKEFTIYFEGSALAGKRIATYDINIMKITEAFTE